MKFGQPDPEIARARLIRRTLLRHWFRRLGGAFLAMVALVSVLLAIALASAWSRAIDSQCEQQPDVLLDFERVVSLKHRREAWQQRPEPDATFDLNGDEITFILREMVQANASVALAGNEGTVKFGLPTDGGCYNVAYVGQISVDNRVAYVTPRELRVGRLNLSPWVAGRTFAAPRERVLNWFGKKAAQILTNSHKIRIANGRASIAFYDRYAEF